MYVNIAPQVSFCFGIGPNETTKRIISAAAINGSQYSTTHLSWAFTFHIYLEELDAFMSRGGNHMD